jgi:hypothetical protein
MNYLLGSECGGIGSLKPFLKEKWSQEIKNRLRLETERGNTQVMKLCCKFLLRQNREI